MMGSTPADAEAVATPSVKVATITTFATVRLGTLALRVDSFALHPRAFLRRGGGHSSKARLGFARPSLALPAQHFHTHPARATLLSTFRAQVVRAPREALQRSAQFAGRLSLACPRRAIERPGCSRMPITPTTDRPTRAAVRWCAFVRAATSSRMTHEGSAPEPVAPVRRLRPHRQDGDRRRLPQALGANISSGSRSAIRSTRHSRPRATLSRVSVTPSPSAVVDHLSGATSRGVACTIECAGPPATLTS